MAGSWQAKWGLMAWLVASWAVTPAKCTSFQECYFTCFVICAVMPGVAFFDCPLRGLQACIVPSYPIDNDPHTFLLRHQQQNHFFYHLGCAASTCANLSTHQNPAEKKVGSCVDSCSQSCSMV